jgi:hypothetical protein
MMAVANTTINRGAENRTQVKTTPNRVQKTSRFVDDLAAACFYGLLFLVAGAVRYVIMKIGSILRI